MARRVKLSHIDPDGVWAKEVAEMLPAHELKSLIRWWKGKKAKAIWGTDKARRKRQALMTEYSRRYAQ